MTEAELRRRIEIVEDFARFRQDVSFGTIGIGVRLPPDYDPARNRFRNAEKRRALRAIDRANDAARPVAAELPPPLPRVACPVCGMVYGCDAAVTCHRRRARH